MDIIQTELELRCEITNLVCEIEEAAQAYYTGQAIMTDREFDRLVDRLRSLDPNNIILKTPGWGYVPGNGMDKVAHKYQLVGSLGKYRDMDAVKSAYEGDLTHAMMSSKLDGISCVAYYKDGRLVNAVTRGNGTEGIDVTDRFLSTQGGLSILNDLKFTGGVRGEFVMTNSDWDRFKENYPDYKNSRNAVAGIVNAKYSTYKDMHDKLKYASFVTYKIMGDESLIEPDYDEYGVMGPNSYENVLTCLDYLGFKVVPYKTNLEDYKEFYEFCRKTYPCDGIVLNFGINWNEGSPTISYNDVAFKFEDDVEESTVNRMSWNFTRTGKLMPVANIDPIELAGATVRRVTCFNAKYVKDNRIGVGAIISVARSGEVIPDIRSVISECPNPEIPTRCPECGAPLVWDGVDLVCEDPFCVGKRYLSLKHFIATTSAVKGVSGKGIEEFIDILGYSDIEVIWDLSKDEAIRKLNNYGLGQATLKKYLEMVEWLYGDMDPRYFLCGMNIPGLGWKVADSLVKNHIHLLIKDYHTELDKEIISDSIYAIPGCGYAIAKSILDHLAYLRCIANKIKFKEDILEESQDPKDIQYFCVTGGLNSGSRSEFCSMVKEYGWEMADIKKSKYLVTNNPDPSSSKGRKAKELGVEIITEEEFLKIIKGK